MYPVPQLFHPRTSAFAGTPVMSRSIFPNITTGFNRVNACGGFYTGVFIPLLPRR